MLAQERLEAIKALVSHLHICFAAAHVLPSNPRSMELCEIDQSSENWKEQIQCHRHVPQQPPSLDCSALGLGALKILARWAEASSRAGLKRSLSGSKPHCSKRFLMACGCCAPLGQFPPAGQGLTLASDCQEQLHVENAAIAGQVSNTRHSKVDSGSLERASMDVYCAV